MELVTQRDTVKMKFNLERREINSVGDYMKLYLKILQLAFEYDIITAKQRDAIASSILIAIQKAAGGNEIIVSNYVYVISMRFMTLSNFDCWELMRKITCQEEANNFVSETRSWFLERVNEDLEKANRGYKLSLNLRNASIISTWENYYKTLKIMSGCLEIGSEFNLKSKHSECLVVSMYTTMNVENGITCLDRVEDYLRMFEIETSILVKIDADKIIKSILRQRSEKIEIEASPKLEQARQDYQDAVDKLTKLEAFYAERLKKALASEDAYNRIYDEFEEAHPDLDEDEFEDAFDKYWMSCPEYFPDDYLSVEKEYHKKRAYQQKQIDICKRSLDILEDERAELRNMMSRNGEVVTLEDILKEYAIAFLAQEGYIEYPNTPIEKEQLLSRISRQMAAKIFLQNEDNKVSLTVEECNYLNN